MRQLILILMLVGLPFWAQAQQIWWVSYPTQWGLRSFSVSAGSQTEALEKAAQLCLIHLAQQKPELSHWQWVNICANPQDIRPQ